MINNSEVEQFKEIINGLENRIKFLEDNAFQDRANILILKNTLEDLTDTMVVLVKGLEVK